MAETHQTLVLNNLRSRIAVEVQLAPIQAGPRRIIAALLRAENPGSRPRRWWPSAAF